MFSGMPARNSHHGMSIAIMRSWAFIRRKLSSSFFQVVFSIPAFIVFIL